MLCLTQSNKQDRYGSFFTELNQRFNTFWPVPSPVLFPVSFSYNSGVRVQQCRSRTTMSFAHNSVVPITMLPVPGILFLGIIQTSVPFLQDIFLNINTATLWEESYFPLQLVAQHSLAIIPAGMDVSQMHLWDVSSSFSETSQRELICKSWRRLRWDILKTSRWRRFSGLLRDISELHLRL